MRNKAYFNGKIVDFNKIKISPYDIGFLRGFGVFDVMCTQNKKPFLLDDHWERFKNSARELNINISISKEKYIKVVKKLLKYNNYQKSTIRTILSGGKSSNGFSYEPKNETFLILIEKFISLPDNIFKNGAKLITVDYTRDFPKAKTINYAMAIKNQRNKEVANALEIVYIHNKKALEASTSNFFMVKNGKIITTKDGILLGITRKLVIELAKNKNFQVEIREIEEKEMLSADEIFLTATNKDIVPVIKINAKKIGNGRVGKITRILMNEFNQFVKAY